MKLWITRNEDELSLWRVKPHLDYDGMWWDDDEDYDAITEEVYYSLTDYRDLPKADDELVEIEVNVTSQDSSKEHIKNRRHK